MSAASTELRIAMIAAMEADAGVQATAMGALPRIFNRAPPANQGETRVSFPYIVIRTASARANDTNTDWGKEIDAELHLMGEYEGDEQGEDIFFAIERLFRDTWAPRDLTAHHLVNLVCTFSDVRSDEDGKRYFGLQRWRAVTEEVEAGQFDFSNADQSGLIVILGL